MEQVIFRDFAQVRGKLPRGQVSSEYREREPGYTVCARIRHRASSPGVNTMDATRLKFPWLIEPRGVLCRAHGQTCAI